MSDKKIPKSLKDFNFHNRYEIRREIGRGSYGSVFKAFDRVSKKYVAIKHLHNIFSDIIDGKRAFREIALLQRLKQPNIVSLLDVYVEKDDLINFNDVCVVLEFAESDLKNYMRSGVHLEMRDIIQITYHILAGLNYLHSAGVLHRDLKPANVLLFENGYTKICDFGLSRFVDIMSASQREIEDHSTSDQIDEKDTENSEKQGLDKEDVDGRMKAERANVRRGSGEPKFVRKLTSHVVTRWYRAPELILIEKNYDDKIDVWSLGCIFAELLHCLKFPELELLPRKPFFPGQSCFPLSPDKTAPVSDSGFPVSNKDQLLMIVERLGSPDAKDLEFVSDKGALSYIQSLPQRKKLALRDYFRWVDPQVLSFLEGCLVFNPNYRWTIAQCLVHPIFKDIRSLQYEEYCKRNTGVETAVDEHINDVADLRRLFVSNVKITVN
jgi:mitogen-activated protein kinase 1/3